MSKTKTVFQFNRNGEFIREYKSTRYAGLCVGANKSAIATCCNGRAKTSCNCIWLYSDDPLLDAYNIGDSTLKLLIMERGLRDSYKRTIIKKDKEGNIIKIWRNERLLELEVGLYKSYMIDKSCEKKKVNEDGYYYTKENR